MKSGLGTLIKIDILQIIALFLIIVIASYSGNQQLLILFISVFLIIVAFNSVDRFFLLFSVIYLSNGIINREAYLLGYFGVHQIAALLAWVVLIHRKFYLRRRLEVSNNIGKYYLYFILLYSSITVFKNAIFNLFNTDFEEAFLKTINFIFITLPVILFIKGNSANAHLYYRIVIGSVVFFVISAVAANLLVSLNLYTMVESNEGLERYYGLYGNGDSNTLSTVLVISFGLVLTRVKSEGFSGISLFILLLILLGLGLTGSRNGIVSLGVVLLVFSIKSNRSIQVLRVILVAIIISISSVYMLKTSLDRLFKTGTEQNYSEGNTSNRIGKWAFYIDYFLDNPISILRGGDSELQVGWDNRFQVAHNFFIQIIYNCGIVFLVLFLILLIKTYLKRKWFKDDLSLIFIPLLLGIIFISDYGAILFFIFPLQALRGKQNFINEGRQ